jgi:ribosomal protein S18 acetylase RimI-like enzyme
MCDFRTGTRDAIAKYPHGVRLMQNSFIKNSFTIRKATVNDAEDIQSVLRESFKKYKDTAKIPGPLGALEETVEDITRDIQNKEVLIALIDNITIGSIRVELLPDNTAYITRFGVRPDYQSMGIGKALICHVDKLLISKGIREARLYTASNHHELVQFYYDKGFYIESVSYERGYPRACMVKKYGPEP